MHLTVFDENEIRTVEGASGEAMLLSANDVDRVIEACFAEGASAALLYAANLPPAFFDLSSGEAGVILQKLRTYRIRLAIVAAPDERAWSSRFGEMVADEQRGTALGVFETRHAACVWLASPGTAVRS